MTHNCKNAAGGVQPLIEQAAARLALRARGRVLQLGRPLALDLPRCSAPVGHVEHPAQLGEVPPFDTVLSVCGLWRPEWDEAELGRLARRLCRDGRLLFVEPVAVTGASGLAQRLAGAALRRRHGVGFDRDVPAVLRSAGLVPVSIDRLTADRRGRVRSFVAGAAVARPVQPQEGSQ